jgi:hypothetical protein
VLAKTCVYVFFFSGSVMILELSMDVEYTIETQDAYREKNSLSFFFLKSL